MIKVLPESNGNILIVSAAGKLTDQDYKEILIPRLESIIREHGKARLLLDLGDEFYGWGLKIAKLAISGELKSFSSSERAESLRWIKA